MPKKTILILKWDPCVTRPSATIILIVQDKQIPILFDSETKSCHFDKIFSLAASEVVILTTSIMEVSF